MNKCSLFRTAVITFLILTIVNIDSCNFDKHEDRDSPTHPQDQEVATNNPSDETTTVLEATPQNTTIYNRNQDLWGWHTGEYIILKWDPEKYSQFMIYRKTESDSKWQPAVENSISKNEFFDNMIANHKILRYKVEAVNKDNKIVHTYDQLMFKFGD